MDSEVTLDRVIGRCELPLTQLDRVGERRELEIHDEEEQSAGILVVVGRVSRLYIVVRDIAGASEGVRMWIDGTEVSVGRSCPLDEETKVRVKVGEVERLFAVEELKARQGAGLVWKEMAVRVDYDLYE